MQKRRINALLWIGLMGTILIGSGFFIDVYQAFRGDNGIWWTHQDMRLSLEETKDNLELYIGGELLQKRLSDRTLFTFDKDANQYPVVSSDITVRLNNWANIKASILMRTTISGFALGAAITLLVIGLIQFFCHKGNSPQTKKEV